jgi:hypothetical protein
MNAQTDLDVARGVRRIMVKHWIDLGRLSIRSTGGRVSMYGLLQRISGMREPLTGPLVDEMFREMRRVGGVRFISAHLDNWTDQGGMWRPVEGAAAGKEAAAPLAAPDAAAAARTFRVVTPEAGNTQ